MDIWRFFWSHWLQLTVEKTKIEKEAGRGPFLKKYKSTNLANASEEPSGVDVVLCRRETDERVPDDVRQSQSGNGRPLPAEDLEADAGNEASDEKPDAGQTGDQYC